jgi:hypothetical protein
MGAPHLDLCARLVAALSLATLWLAGCGGGSGGEASPVSEYHVIALQRDIAGDSVASYTVRYASREAGALRGGSGFASSTGGPAAQPDLPFAVDAARSLTASPPWGPPATGRMSEDGVMGAATAVAAGLAPHLMLVVQRHPSPTLADLVGEWFVAGYARRPGATGGSSTTCFLSESQISPAGSLTTTGLEHVNSDGVVTSGIPSVTALSSVSVDGALTPPFSPDLGIFTFVSGKCHVRLGAVELRGAAGPAGRYVLTTGGYTSGDETGLFTFVR